jgi:hypothetical protein
MKLAVGNWLAALAILLGSHTDFAAAPDPQEPFLTWRKNKSADARIDNLPLPKMLSRLSTATGWKIFLQPGLDQNISVQFQNAAQGDALKLLLGNLSYALVPQTGGVSKLYVYKTSLSDATALVEPDRASRPKNWLEKEMIISLAPGSKQDVDKLAAELGGKVVAKSEALNAYRLEFPDAETAEAARQKIASRDDLAYQDNFSYERPANSSGGTPSPQSLFPIDPKPVPRGEQVVVALVDTPLQPLDSQMQGFILPSIHLHGEPGPLPSDPTHATSMALDFFNSYAFAKSFNSGQEADAFGRVRLLPIDIYGSSSSITTFEMALGIYEAINANVNWINLPHGGQGGSPMVDYLLEQAHGKGIMVSAAAGNEPTTDPTYPAANPYTIAVTAIDSRGNIATYANRGSFVDVKAPGTMKVHYNGNNYYSTGTSTATSYVSGQAAALMVQGLSPLQAANAIRANFNVNAALQLQLRR